MKNERLFLDIHVLQTVPPSCVNRDDTGSPKTAVYGGVRRARVSSQAWKHAIRLAFRDMYEPEKLASRTLYVADLVAKYIHNLAPEAKAQDLAQKCLKAGKVDVVEKNGVVKSKALFFMSEAQAKALAQVAVSSTKDGKEFDEACKEALKLHPSIDIALFGRMVASDPTLNTDACSQVAHAISTHGVQNEFDYFTAVDDLSPEDTSGAGHLGTIEFNSSTMYRYATVNISELEKNLGAETPKAIRNFLDAFIRSMPTGKQNTFANRTLPDGVYVTLRCDQPINLVGAFEKPVLADETGGYVEGSQNRLADYAKQVYHDYTGEPEKAWCVGSGMKELADAMPLSRLLDTIEECLNQRLGKDDDK